MESLIILLSLATLVIAFVVVKSSTKNRYPLPPGPPSLPLIGHAHLIPPVGLDLFFYKLSKTYGDVIHLKVLNKSFIVLNSVKAAVDLADKRGTNYGGRPSLPVFEIQGVIKMFSFKNEGEEDYRVQRKMFQQYFNKEKSREYRGIQTREARLLAQALLSSPGGHKAAILRFSAAVIIDITYGHQVTESRDPYLQIADECCRLLNENGPPGATPVDFFPILRHFPSWFPGTYYANFARASAKSHRKLIEYPVSKVTEQMANGTARQSFLSFHLDAMRDQGLADDAAYLEQIKATSAIVYVAGTETTSSTLSFFLLAMLLYPECQVQARKEIDSVIGPDRLPEFEDREKLPYLESILQEVNRWNHAVPSGVPHRALEDDIYRGMLIPKDSTIVLNTRGMTLDESVYKDPTRFDPTRFLPAPAGRGEPYTTAMYGFGHRKCPGRYLADNSLWVAIATILSTVSISPAIGVDGKEIIPEPIPVVTGISNQPKPFPCRIEPRSHLAARSLSQYLDSI